MSHLIEDETRLYVVGDYRYRLQFYVDSDPSPPWEDEGAVPLIWTGGRDGFRKEGARGYDLLNPFPFLKDRAIRANLAEIAGLVGYGGADAFDQDARDYYPGLPIAEARRALLDDCRAEIEATEEGLETLARFWTLAGVPAEVSTSRGYSQGDWAAVLTVAHPEAVKAFGFATMRAYRKTCPNDHKAAVDAWGAYTWGGVIGYEVARIDSDEYAAALAEYETEELDAGQLNALHLCEDVDSCWGFYPEHDQDYFPLDRNHAYAIGQAEDAAKADAESRAILDAAAREHAAELDAAAMIEARPDMYPEARA